MTIVNFKHYYTRQPFEHTKGRFWIWDGTNNKNATGTSSVYVMLRPSRLVHTVYNIHTKIFTMYFSQNIIALLIPLKTWVSSIIRNVYDINVKLYLKYTIK